MAHFVFLARLAASAGRDQFGIVLVTGRQLPPGDMGSLVRARDALTHDRPASGALENHS